jgi:hypothetical protein
MAQLVIDKREQFLGGGGIAVLDTFQNARDVAHGDLGFLPEANRQWKRESCAKAACRKYGV